MTVGEQNPWQYDAGDYLGRHMTVSIPWDPATRALQAGTCVRDPGCQYTTLIVGVDGNAGNVLNKTFGPVPDGTTSLTVAALKRQGFATVDDLEAAQVTAS